MDVKSATAAERRELAAMLEDLPAAGWDAPTLCTGWRVREVAAHMSMGFRLSMPRMVLELAKSRGGINRMADRRAREDAAAMSTAELVGAIRDNAGHPWKPPVGGTTAALGHDVVHGLDITVALGIDRRVPDERVHPLLENVSVRAAKFFGADLNGIELRADDLDWSFGTGVPVTGSAQDLLLVAFGRKLPPGRLQGQASERYVAA
ncbi:maleylpyruvate isomerase family mycothiol-dependent enzyme [Actinomadura sp. 7K507]|uniref:maleylpyruvate isomerase family mycothiol-dependent enzyme n=1 Tax=Actinomadura sp. 7K507 TaxID=2530365 RepID=UPI00104F94F7|nr:maleylpyruvate isomerase family mycothiol-dependent enzyme [Actinomadura sp. 7K507]TDC87435.1 maleylpyruvate isomerase family mycothiol-dependent enzyme [Actinomadura sp. 7K507]